MEVLDGRQPLVDQVGAQGAPRRGDVAALLGPGHREGEFGAPGSRQGARPDTQAAPCGDSRSARGRAWGASGGGARAPGWRRSVGGLRWSVVGAIPPADDPGKPSRPAPGPPASAPRSRSVRGGGPGAGPLPGGRVDGERDGLWASYTARVANGEGGSTEIDDL